MKFVDQSSFPMKFINCDVSGSMILDVSEAVGVKIVNSVLIKMTMDGYIIKGGVKYNHDDFVNCNIPFASNYHFQVNKTL